MLFQKPFPCSQLNRENIQKDKSTERQKIEKRRRQSNVKKSDNSISHNVEILTKKCTIKSNEQGGKKMAKNRSAWKKTKAFCWYQLSINHQPCSTLFFKGDFLCLWWFWLNSDFFHFSFFLVNVEWKYSRQWTVVAAEGQIGWKYFQIAPSPFFFFLSGNISVSIYISKVPLLCQIMWSV